MRFQKFQELFNTIESFREAGRIRLVSSYFSLKAKSIAMITDHAKDRYLRLIREKPQIANSFYVAVWSKERNGKDQRPWFEVA